MDSQKELDFDIVGLDGPIICDQCGEETLFLIGLEDIDFDATNYCRDCFARLRPEYAETMDRMAELFFAMIEQKKRCMTLEEMHELYEDNDESDDGD